MNNLFTRKYLHINSIKSTSFAKPQSQGKSNSVHNSSPYSVGVKRNEVILSTRRRVYNKKPQSEIFTTEDKPKLDVMNYLKEKQHTDELRKSLHHKNQIILEKNLKIRQLEMDVSMLKSQLSKYKIKSQEMSQALEINKKKTCEMAHALSQNEHEEEQNDNSNNNDNDQLSYPNLDLMTYEELLELENKIGYVSKGLKQEMIDNIPQLNYDSDEIKETKCLICQYDFEENNLVRKVKCGHVFHQECIDKWLKEEKRCPNCKIDV